MRLVAAALAGAVLWLSCLVAPALAHPHIFVDAKVAIVFDDAGNVTEVQHRWTFDQAFSAWAIQGLDTNNDGVTSDAELQPLADDNIKGLGAYNYYTAIGEVDRPNLSFKSLPNPHMSYADGRITLAFGVRLDTPHRLERTLQLGVDDPEYYVAITFAGPQAVTLVNAPAGCRATLNPPKDLPTDLADKLYALGADVVELPPDLAAAMRGMQGSIDIACDYGVTGPKQHPEAELATPANAATAVSAVNALAAKPIPFGGPPREMGLSLPQHGVLGWIVAQQKEFFQALTDAMAAFKSDNRAFWVLGTLSFLYGIFHAAGPGHGKVVIASYVLANERQYRQGMLLSFASAMLASLVAVVFVLVAALLLNLTGDAMGNAANWIGIGSYAMVTLLGLWLITRHVFGLGHRHGPAPAAPVARRDRDMAHRLLFGEGAAVALAPASPAFAGMEHDDHGHHHHHEHEHEHEHDHAGHSHVAVVPGQLRHGNWREALGVVLAIGLRPCSGALVVLVFALSQGVLWAGIGSVFLMGIGTALTVALLATLAMTAKGLALRLSRSRPGRGMAVLWWGELAGAGMVFGFGVLLLVANLWG